VLVDERMIEPGDWTGPGGAHQVLARRDVEVAVLETARGGIVLRGVGYESNDASVLTNVSSDHLDLQGIHTLPSWPR
jgi:cyanophycin synthetase